MFNQFKRWLCRHWPQTSATHQRLNDHQQRVCIDALRVMIIEESPGVWSALGVEIDYAATGTSVETAQQHFETGLILTIDAHLRKFGTIERLLRFSPPSEWLMLLDSAGQHQLSVETLHHLPVSHLPYQHIAYLHNARPAA